MRKSIQYIKSTKEIIPAEKFKINYKTSSLSFYERLNERFDFTNEWNNLGYGRIENNESKYSISIPTLDSKDFDETLAYVQDENNKNICVFAAIKKDSTNNEATLFINREFGSNDGLDKYLEEDFLSNYQIEKYGSLPILSEVPFNYDGAVTMRIDCDEAISSGEQLYNTYKKHNIPFSLAIKTSLDLENKNKEFIYEVIKNNGAVVGHSDLHEADWGGSTQRAYEEASISKEKLKKILPKNYNFDYVVSPFHQNSNDAVKGLVKAKIKGFIGGIIHNDPDYLQGRAGNVLSGEPIITHSQQCMFHGDCFKETGLSIYKKTFDSHLATNTFFGFLDHPFSSYQYGWNSENQRCDAHEQFIIYMKSNKKIWFANLIEAMNFLWVKSNTKVWIENGRLKSQVPHHDFNIPDFKVSWNNKNYKVSSKESLC